MSVTPHCKGCGHKPSSNHAGRCEHATNVLFCSHCDPEGNGQEIDLDRLFPDGFDCDSYGMKIPCPRCKKEVELDGETTDVELCCQNDCRWDIGATAAAKWRSGQVAHQWN